VFNLPYRIITERRGGKHAGCHTRYYHDYSIQHAAQPNARRKYYGQIPDYIHIAEHSFMERTLCVHFEMQMAFLQ
jgi:hypothetical protein